MKNGTKIMFNNLEFMVIENCGLQLMEEDGEAAYTESAQETTSRKELEKILDRIETDNSIETVNCGSSSNYFGELVQVLEDGEEIAEFVILYN